MNNKKFNQSFVSKILNGEMKYKPSITEYRINLNRKLISYTYDENNKEAVQEKNKFLIPLSAQQITLIKAYNETIEGDPIINVILRGALPEQFEYNTFLKYQEYFPSEKKEEPSIKIKEENIKPKEKKQRKQVAKKKD